MAFNYDFMLITIQHNLCLNWIVISTFFLNDSLKQNLHELGQQWLGLPKCEYYLFKHNIHSLPWWLKRWHWENMSLLAQNMKPTSLTMELKKSWIESCVIMHFMSCAQQNKCQIYGLVAYVLRLTTSCKMGETQSI